MIPSDVPKNGLKGVNHTFSKELNGGRVPKCKNSAELEDVSHRRIVNRPVSRLLSIGRRGWRVLRFHCNYNGRANVLRDLIK